ncbi:hypothetical protein MASR1M90_23810 [Desulfovibrionales bacterium]
MLVCNSIDTICFTINLDEETQRYMVDLQFVQHKLPKWLYPTDSGILRYRYGLVSDGIYIYYTDSELLKPNCYIRFSSEVIQRQGYDKVYMRLCNILKFLGLKGRPGKQLKISQVDLSFDFQADFSKYMEDRENYTIQTKLKNSSDRRQHEAITYRLFGIGSTVGYKVRCYDKLAESKSVPGKSYWHEIWEKMGFSLDRPIWRVEYEIRRDFLKSWKINSFSAFLRCQQAIQKRLFQLWNIKVRDDSNKSRCSFVPEFEFLLEHFTEDFRKHYVDKRPEEFERACALKMSSAVAALISSITNGAAVFKIAAPQNSLSSERTRLLNQFLSLVRDSAIYDDGNFSACVDDVLYRQGYYFAPCGQMYNVPDLGAA